MKEKERKERMALNTMPFEVYSMNDVCACFVFVFEGEVVYLNAVGTDRDEKYYVNRCSDPSHPLSLSNLSIDCYCCNFNFVIGSHLSSPVDLNH